MGWFKRLLLFSVVSVNFSNDIVLEGTSTGYLNPAWDMVGRDLIVKDKKPFIRIDTRGNCRYEWEQKCETDSNGNTNCHMVPEWVCDYRAALFSLPTEVQVKGKDVRYITDGQDIKIGYMKSFLWWKWVKTEEYVEIFSDINTAKLILRGQETLKQLEQFEELHKVNLKKDNELALLNDAPVDLTQTYTVVGPKGTVTVYYDSQNRTQIRGTYKGSQFDSNGPSTIPFNGRSTGVHDGSAFVKFNSDMVTVSLVNHLDAAQVPVEHQQKLEEMSPGCIVNGKILTAVIMILPEGVGIPAAYNVVVPLR